MFGRSFQKMLDEQLGEEAFKGNMRKVEELLSMGANVNASLSNGFTPLVGAALGGHLEVCKLMLSKGASVNKRENGYSPLMGAAQRGHTEVCKLLLETGKANVKETTPYGYTPLLLAAEKGNSEVCKLLLAHGSDVKETKTDVGTALTIAALKGHLDLHFSSNFAPF